MTQALMVLGAVVVLGGVAAWVLHAATGAWSNPEDEKDE